MPSRVAMRVPGARGRGVALCAGRVRLRARLAHDHVQARQGGQATVPPRKGANPDLQGDARPVHQGRPACLSERLSVLQDPRLPLRARSAAFRR